MTGGKGIVGLLAAVLMAWPSGFGPGHRVEEKLDLELMGDGYQPIFVRFEDQLFKKSGDYEAFAAKNENRPRSTLRKEILEMLKAKSDETWRKVGATMEKLVADGKLKAINRFWIVNGMACDASAEGSRALAALPEVAYVFLQRSPGNLRQHRPPVSGKLEDGPLRTATEEALKRAAVPRAKFSLDGAEVPWNLKKIHADEAWTVEKSTGEGVVVAISDNGFSDIPALQASYWHNPKESLNGKDDDGNGYIDDVMGYDFRQGSGLTFGSSGLFHGTMCSGIVAGRPIEGKNLVTGVAPDARLMALNGMGFLRVYEYALANGADVLSMSWMWPNIDLGHYRGVFRLAMEHMAAGGVLPVGGAGNFATNAPEGKQICLPKDVPCCVAVAGILSDGKRPNFSSKGPVMWSDVKFYEDYPASKPLSKPDCTAPNGDYPVWALLEEFPGRDWKVTWKGRAGEGLLEGPRGNSFAGPHAAGVAALILSANPELNPWQVKRIMEETSEDLGAPGRDVEYGAGLLNALRAVQLAKRIKQSE